MSPTLNVGDLVIRGDKEYKDIIADEEKGDILILRGPNYFYEKGFDPLFWGNLEEDTPIIHRAIEKKKVGDKWYFKTKGDNNLVADGGYQFINKTEDYDYIVIKYNSSEVIYISETEILGIVIYKIPYVGYIKIYFYFIFGLLIGIIIFYILLKLLNYEIKIIKIENKRNFI
jgi:signal peptidase I